ncbi:hypothetical protein [Photobacterium nomapromontoriensis]|uniref:hypothetical protein n=1 Tax=Photobacterium nomapromontoriensis TaxID=2910237 RepID=UPI003D125C01
MCLVKTFPPTTCNWDPSVRFKPATEMGCYSVGKDGVAGRLITLDSDNCDNRTHRNRGVKVLINRVSRNALYFELDDELPLTANYHLAVQPLGLLVGYLQRDHQSLDVGLPPNLRYVFVTDSWIPETALLRLVIE